MSINALQNEYRGGIDVLVVTCKQLVSGFAEAVQDVAKLKMQRPLRQGVSRKLESAKRKFLNDEIV